MAGKRRSPENFAAERRKCAQIEGYCLSQGAFAAWAATPAEAQKL
jgi:hypothetical protein